MNFFEHPFWPLLVFGFLICPRILLLTLWYPIRAKLGETVAYPVLSYFGWFLAPRLTLACIFAGYYWNVNKELVVIAFILSCAGEAIEKLFMPFRLFKLIFRRRFNP